MISKPSGKGTCINAADLLSFFWRHWKLIFFTYQLLQYTPKLRQTGEGQTTKSLLPKCEGPNPSSPVDIQVSLLNGMEYAATTILDGKIGQRSSTDGIQTSWNRFFWLDEPQARRQIPPSELRGKNRQISRGRNRGPFLYTVVLSRFRGNAWCKSPSLQQRVNWPRPEVAVKTNNLPTETLVTYHYVNVLKSLP